VANVTVSFSGNLTINQLLPVAGRMHAATQVAILCSKLPRTGVYVRVIDMNVPANTAGVPLGAMARSTSVDSAHSPVRYDDWYVGPLGYWQVNVRPSSMSWYPCLARVSPCFVPSSRRWPGHSHSSPSGLDF
jgi:hypothetical protein